ncbi:MAG: hypothetical protein ABI887_18170 [Burkholderiales bacterium]
MNTEAQSLINRFAGFLGVPRLTFALAVGVLLALLLLGAAFADGRFTVGGPWGLWKIALEPTIIVYILGASPLLQRRWMLAIDALRPLADRPELVEQAYTVSRRGEWAALMLGAAFSAWVTSSPQIEGRWLRVYDVASNALMFSLMALVIYDGMVRTRRLSRVIRSGLHLDLFDHRLLTPLARWGQSISLSFVGGACLSLLFQSSASLRTVQSLVIYSIVVLVSLTLFFTSVWGIHDALVAAQERELSIVRHHWFLARIEMKKKLAEGGQSNVASLYDPIVVLNAYERQILAASTWPFNPKIVKELVVSLLAPFLIYGLKITIGLSGN